MDGTAPHYLRRRLSCPEDRQRLTENAVPVMYAEHPFDRMSHILQDTDFTHPSRGGCRTFFT